MYDAYATVRIFTRTYAYELLLAVLELHEMTLRLFMF